MKEKIRQKMSELEFQVGSEERWLEAQVSELKEKIQKYDANSIGTFVPGMVNAINESRQRLHVLNEQLRMLTHLENEDNEWYGIVRWHPYDVISAASLNDVTLTFDQAVAWLEKNEEAFKNRMTELGNEVLEDMDYRGGDKA